MSAAEAESSRGGNGGKRQCEKLKMVIFRPKEIAERMIQWRTERKEKEAEFDGWMDDKCKEIIAALMNSN